MDTRSRIARISKETSALLLNPRFLGPCLAGIFCLIVATVIGVSILFTMAVVLLSLPIAGYVVGNLMLRACTVQREPRMLTTQGEYTGIPIRITSAHGSFPRPLEARDRERSGIESQAVEAHEVPTENGWEAEARLWLRPLKRGRYTVGPVEVRASDPLGMFKINRRLKGTTDLLVYPRPVRVDAGSLSGEMNELGSATAAGRAAPRGEFAGVRDYRRGDELRRIHWKTTARTQRLSVIEYEDSAMETAVVALDLSSGSDYGKGIVTSADVAVGAAAYAVNEHVKAHRRVRLLISEGISFRTIEIAAPERVSIALTALAEAKPDARLTGPDLLRSALGAECAVLFITTRCGDALVATVREAATEGKAVNIALVDPRPFDPHQSADLWKSVLVQAGARVQLVSEAAQP